MKRGENLQPGTMIGKRGYILRMSKGHPRANRDGYVPEHILVAEKAIGHFITEGHPVHHMDRVVTNNVNRNLVVCENQAYHKLLHQRQRAMEACGDPMQNSSERRSVHDLPMHQM
jgi:hypothetical protein